MPSFLFSYFWFQTSSVSPKALDSDPVWILPDPAGFLDLGSMERLTPKVSTQKRLLYNRILKISLRSRYWNQDQNLAKNRILNTEGNLACKIVVVKLDAALVQLHVEPGRRRLREQELRTRASESTNRIPE